MVQPGQKVNPLPQPTIPISNRAGRVMLSRFFIHRPNFAIVISVVITLAGLLSLLVIPVSQYPDITPPQVTVSTTYPGAGATTVD